ncbi:MAG TPA: aldose 1-epimerase family protein [Holophaga sp.]|jgi:galactose mutarotase-like enzyme|nr:aldose 1-epimerase family protein [Holophaga sp.]
MDSCVLQNLYLKAAIRAKGAEVCGLQTLTGVDLLWDGDPAIWPRQSPHLFPLVGRLKGDIFRHQGQEYRMPPHGFARGLDFQMVRLTREDCTLVLRDDETTRAMFPFAFELRINIALEGPSLRVFYELINRGDEPLPANLGAMPAFRWPLEPGVSKDAYRIKFELPEPGSVGRLVDGFLDESKRLGALEDRTMALRDELFLDDTLVFENLRSRKIRYDAPGSLMLEISWDGFQHLAVWGKPGADFICIQPWRGKPGDAEVDGEFTERPGVTLIPVGGRRAYRYAVTMVPEP